MKQAKKYISIAIVLAALLALGDLAALARSEPGAGSGAQDAAPAVIDAAFACSGGKTIDAQFVTDQVSLRFSDGRSLVLPRALSASGARYASPDGSIVFWNKGDTAFVTENGQTTYDGCVTGA